MENKQPTERLLDLDRQIESILMRDVESLKRARSNALEQLENHRSATGQPMEDLMSDINQVTDHTLHALELLQQRLGELDDLLATHSEYLEEPDGLRAPVLEAFDSAEETVQDYFCKLQFDQKGSSVIVETRKQFVKQLQLIRVHLMNDKAKVASRLGRALAAC